MNILVIGNGFDIAHGLNTSYSDFLEFVRSIKNTGSFNNELKKCVLNNHWIDYFDSIFEERKSAGKDGWIDFESEVSTVIEALDSYYNYLNNSDYRGIRAVVMDNSAFEILNRVLNIDTGKTISREKNIYINKLKEWKQILLDDLNKLTRGLEIYLCKHLNEGKTDCLPIVEKVQPDYVISFNYTKTYEKLYPKCLEIDYIHGVVNKESDTESNNMVLGIGEFITDDRRDYDNEFIEFKKFYQRIYKNTGSKYKKWLKEYEANRNLGSFNGPGQPYHELNIHFFGHSLDPTDGDILKDLINCEYANISIYYHNKIALSKQIANLVRVIGEDKIIELTDKSEGRVKFISCI